MPNSAAAQTSRCLRRRPRHRPEAYACPRSDAGEGPFVTEIHVVHAQGEGFARGLHIGTELSAPIRDSVEFYHRYLDRRGVSSEQLQDSPDALPGRGRNRLPRHDERAEGHVGRGHGADPRVVRHQRLRRARTAAGVARRRAVVPAEEGRLRGAAHHPAGRRTLFERLGERRRRDDAGAQRALARRRCGQHRRHRGQARRRTRAGRLTHHRVLPAGGRHERPRRRAGIGPRSPRPTTAWGSPGCW